MRWWRSLRMRDVTIFTLPVVLVGLYVLAASILDYYKARQFDDWWSRGASVNNFLAERIWAAVNFPKVTALQLWLKPDEDDAGVIRLRVDRNQWGLWQRDPLSLWGQWVDALLLHENKQDPVKLRKRGDTSVHWITPKKSFTLKTPRSSLFKGYPRLVFSGKSVLPQYLANRLASEFNLLAPFTTISPVFVNDSFYGLYRTSELIDESFLRRQGRMPGNIFRGETAERGESFKGLPRDLFINPYIWDRVAVNDRPAVAGTSTLQAFLAHLNGTTFNDHLTFMRWLDQDEVARLIAYMLVIGDPYHMSEINNQFWYEDPSSGLLHVIPWDLRLLNLEQMQNQHQANKFLRVVLRNPFVLDAAFRSLHQKLAGGRLFQTAEHLVRNVYSRYEDHFKYDLLRRGIISDVGTPDEALSVLSDNIRLLEEWFKDSTIAFYAETQLANTIILDFEARGHVGSDLYAIELDGNPEVLRSIRLIADQNLNGKLDKSDTEMSGKWELTRTGGRLALTTLQALLPGFDSEGLGINPAPIHYRFFITTSGNILDRVIAVRADLRNRLTGEAAKVITLKSGDLVSPTTSWHPWQYPLRSPIRDRWVGDKHLRKTLVIEEGDTLIVEAGTTVWMDPDVSILARGRILALGSQQHPITFRPTVKGKPWGTIALQGVGASGSVFKHVRFVGGGGGFLDRVEYKGMVSVHWVDKVLFQHCYFADNVRSDDALNAVHANVVVQDCTFFRTNADAIDFDYSSGEIYNCRFENAGNDAIDLMTSGPRIVGNHITGSGDKGISIGEKSHPFVFNNYIAESARGVEVKDGSEPFLINNLITNNAIGVLQSLKNWRYGGGGWAKLVNTLIVDNKEDVRSDKASRHTEVGSVIGPEAVTLGKGTPGSPGVEDINWIFAHYGVRPTSNTVGLLDSWMSVETIPPREWISFDDDFNEIADGWVASGGVTGLEKRDQNLVVSFDRKLGQISRGVNWNLTAPEFTYTAVFELTGLNLKSASISLLSDEGKVTYPFQTTGDSSYIYVTVQMKPARYSAIQIAAIPRLGTGQIKLHTYRLYAIPKSDRVESGERLFALSKSLIRATGDR